MFTNSQVHYLTRESLRSFYQMKGIAVVSTLSTGQRRLVLPVTCTVGMLAQGAGRLLVSADLVTAVAIV